MSKKDDIFDRGAVKTLKNLYVNPFIFINIIKRDFKVTQACNHFIGLARS